MFASIFQCDLPTVTCELQDSTEEQVKRKRRHLEPSVTLLAQIGNDSTLKRRRPKPSRTRAKLFSATEPPFARKNTMFHANPNILKTKKPKRKKTQKKWRSEELGKALQLLVRTFAQCVPAGCFEPSEGRV
jgi:exonuclease VII large subunit